VNMRNQLARTHGSRILRTYQRHVAMDEYRLVSIPRQGAYVDVTLLSILYGLYSVISEQWDRYSAEL
jgi:hypothetical protein